MKKYLILRQPPRWVLKLAMGLISELTKMAIFGLLESQVEFPFLVLHGLNVVLKTQELGDTLRLFREYEILFLNKIRKNKSLSYLYDSAPCLSIFL